MKRCALIVVWCLLSLMVATVLTGPTHLLTQSLGMRWGIDSVFGRLFIVCTLGFLFLCFRKRLGFDTLGSLGLGYDPQWRGKLGWGILFGILSVTLLHSVYLFLGGETINFEHRWPYLVEMFIKGVASGVAVALIEEVFFRGILFASIRKEHSLPWAFGISSGLYALVHFFKLEGDVSLTAGFFSGFPLLVRFSEQIVGHFSVNYFMGLFLIGVLLCWAFMSTGSLYMSCAIHGTWVCMLRIDGFMIDRVDSARGWLFGQQYLVEGVLGWLCILGIFPLVYLYTTHSSKRYPNGRYFCCSSED